MLALLGTACSSESVVTLAPVEPNATRSTPAATAETTMTTTEAPTSTTAPAATTTGFTAPPTTDVDPARVALSGLWRWAGTHTRYIRLQDHGAIEAGDVVDDALQLDRIGRWSMNGEMMEIRFLQVGGTCANDAVGIYQVSRSGSRLWMDLVTDDCNDRARWLIGSGRTSRTWIRAEE